MIDADLADTERELTALALSGADWSGILDHLIGRARLPVSLIGVHGAPLVEPVAPGAPSMLDQGTIATVFARGTDPMRLDGAGPALVVLPVFSGNRRVGLLAAHDGEGATAWMAAARTAIAIEGVRRDTLRQARAENATQVVDELRYGSVGDPARVTRAAQKFGIALDKPHRAVVFHYAGPQRDAWATAVAWLPTPTRLSGDLAWTIVDARSAADLPTHVRTRMQGIVGTHPLRMSVGPTVNAATLTAASFRCAEYGLGLLTHRGGTDIDYDDLGVEQLLMEMSVEQLHAFTARQIGPILNRDDLMTTLELWFELDGSRGAIADRLFLHRNSVGYRLGLIKQLLGADSLEPTESPRLHAGLVAHAVAQAMETFHALEAADHSMITPSPST